MDAVLSGASTPTANAATVSLGDPDMDAVLRGSLGQRQKSGPLDKYIGFQESQLHGATGGVASLAGGLGYLGSLALDRDPETAEKDRAGIVDALTYSPRTEEGKKQSAAMGEAASYLGQKGGEITGPAVADLATKVGASPEVAGGLGAAANVAYNIPQFILGGKAGDEVGARGPVAPLKPSVTDEVLKKGQELGYVVPPATSNPTLFNKLTEGAVGKLSTAQAASIKNQPVTDNLVRQELGLDPHEELTHDTMAQVRASQSPAYEAVKAIPTIKFGPDYVKEVNGITKTADKITSALPDYKATGAEQVRSLVDSIKPPTSEMDGETAVELSKSLRAEASSYHNSANRSGDPRDRAMGAAYTKAATAVENAIQSHLESSGQPELAENWDSARRTIAKTYSVENALDGAGHVDAGKLAKQSIKGKPLSGNLEAIADFANSFPKATKVNWSKESVPGLSPVDVYGGSALGLAAGLHTGEMLPAAVGAAVPISRMVGREALLTKAGQKLSRPSPPNPGSILSPFGQAAISGAVGPQTLGDSMKNDR